MKRLSPGVRFLLGFITFLLCVALFVTAFAGILVSNVVQILSSQENLETLLRQVLFTDLNHSVSVHATGNGNAPVVRQVPVKTLAPADIRFSEQQTSTSMVEWIYEALVEDFGDEMQVSLETVKDFVERSTLDDFLVEKGAGLLNDVYTGESTVTLSAEEIKAKIEENAPLIEEVFNVVIDPQVIADITTVIEENEYVARIEEEGIVNIIMNPTGTTPPPSEDGEQLPTDDSEELDIQQIIETARAILSVSTILTCAGVCLLLILLILLVNMKQIWVGLNKAGITLMLAALPAVALTVVVWTVPAGWSAQMGLATVMEVLVRQIVTINSVICISVFAFGLLLLVAGIVTMCLVRSKYKKAAAARELEETLLAEVPSAPVDFPAEEETAEEEQEDPAEEEPAEEAPAEGEPEEETETV